MNKRVCALRRKLSILTGRAYGCWGDDVLAQRLGDRVNTALRPQLSEYIVPVKPNGACADTKCHTDFFVGFAFRAPGQNIVFARADRSSCGFNDQVAVGFMQARAEQICAA